jgi:protein associated with RNAse G/E
MARGDERRSKHR